MAAVVITFTAELWEWQGPASWHFLTVPGPLSEELREETDGQAAGFGSLPVRVTVGGTSWETSVFPSKEHGGYLLPVKKPVRRKEDLLVGDEVEVRLELRLP